jgi:hypothetical protein
METKWRRSYAKEDSLKIAKQIAGSHDIKPYTNEELAEVIMAGAKTGEITKEKRGASYHLTNVEEWFKERLMPNTIILSKEQYKLALYRSLKLLVLGNIAQTDFGSSRQRDFGQRWTDFTRGFLGELGIRDFFNKRLSAEVDLEEARVGEVEEFLPKDIVKIKDDGSWRDVKTNVSIKTSKLKSMWLDIGSQLEHSDAFVFIKIGLTTDHLLSFMKDIGWVKDLVQMAKDMKETEDIEKELKELSEKIPDVKPFSTYISGFVWQDELRNGQLEIHEATKKKTVVGGLGKFNLDNADEVNGIGEIGDGKYIASLNALRWKKEDWEELKNKM